jgi:hypothetical protein
MMYPLFIVCVFEYQMELDVGLCDVIMHDVACILQIVHERNDTVFNPLK